MKKEIISKTILFIMILAFIITFEMIFGSENVLLGVTTVTALLMFLRKDLSLNPIKNAIGLIIFNVFLGLMAYLSTINPFLGIPINFIAIFIIMYSLCYNLDAPSYLPFGLQYLFMISRPISFNQLPMRLLALTVGAVLILIPNLILNRNKIIKTGNKLLSESCNLLIKKINAIKNNEPFNEIDEKIKDTINKYKEAVYHRRENSFYLTNENTIKIDISLTLDKINYILDDINNSDNKNYYIEHIFDSLTASLNDAELYLSANKELNHTNNLSYNNHNTSDLIILKIINSINLLNENLKNLNNLDKKEYDTTNTFKDIPDYFKKSYSFKMNFTKKSLRFSFAIRAAVGISFSAFLMSYFKLAEGRWIAFTVFSLTQPQYERSKQRFKDRLFATIVGLLIIDTLFSIFKTNTTRSLVMLVAGYLCSFITVYRYQTILNTISAVGAAALTSNAFLLSIDRIFYVLLGSAIALLLNEFLFPYNAQDEKRDLLELYDKTIIGALTNIKEIINNNSSHSDIMKNCVLIGNMIEGRLKLNPFNSDTKMLNEFLDSGRFLILNIYDLYQLINKNVNNTEDYIAIKDDIELLIKEHKKNNESQFFINQINHIKDFNTKLIISNCSDILLELNKFRDLKSAL